MADQARLVGNDRERGIVAHRADRFLGAFHHRREDQLHIFERLPGGDLAARQLGTLEARDRVVVGLRQRFDPLERLDHPGIIGFTGNAVLDRAVVQQHAFVEINREHLARPEPTFLDHGRFWHDDHAAFRANDHQTVDRADIAQGTQRVAVHARHCPAAIGHRQRGGAVPRLHHARQILIHREVIGRHVGIVRHGFGHQHQLGGGRIAARAADRLEHRVERGGVRRARRDHRLDVFRLLAEREARHLDFVAEHPVLVAANGVDLTIVRQRAERLRQPPLREGVGRIALMKDRDAALETRIAQIGIEDRQRFGEEQPLIDDRAARQRADVKALNLRGDDTLLDPATDEIQVLFKLGGTLLLGQRAGDHDLFDLGARGEALLPDHRHIDGHLAPAIDGIAFLDDRAFDDRAAILLRAKIGARQEDHADREPVGQRAMARGGDRIVEEFERKVDVQASTIAGLAIGIDRTAMPYGLQRIDRGLHDPARRRAIGRRDEADAARIALKFGAVHAVFGEAEAFGFHRHGLAFFAAVSAKKGASAAPTASVTRFSDISSRSLLQSAPIMSNSGLSWRIFRPSGVKTKLYSAVRSSDVAFVAALVADAVTVAPSSAASTLRSGAAICFCISAEGSIPFKVAWMSRFPASLW
ncbi:hypothetical protein D9M73_100870 [compost metagenome]